MCVWEKILKPPSFFSLSGYRSDGTELQRSTIREKLSELFGETRGEFTLPLGKKLKKSTLTISKKRNIKRQALLNEVGKRNDSVFFATIGIFVIVPPFAILAIAVLTGYVELMPWFRHIDKISFFKAWFHSIVTYVQFIEGKFCSFYFYFSGIYDY